MTRLKQQYYEKLNHVYHVSYNLHWIEHTNVNRKGKTRV